ncbi:IS1182 family transposase [Nitrosospira multiformis]|uniref:IS1182 family transposase n=1 Tax=Nitrosospira multiformis TaxID=1231 RepID=UPI00089B758F|nr:IS1182 family transposase [Nitrosospira multiformis]SEA70147.1 transposase, IS4 family [Nitrosospira multiformis]
MTHITGPSRHQTTLFPESLDELIAQDHPVRVIDAFVDSLDLGHLGFKKVVAETTGRPPYAPGDLLKLYVYGYLNRVRSSRMIERETRRNIEVMWLVNRVSPTYKTIADFRRDHAQAIVGVCREFICFCRGQQLFGGELLAIDGTRVEAAASRKQVVTPKRLAEQMAVLDQKIEGYLMALDEADRHVLGTRAACPDVAAALAALKEQRQQLQRRAQEMADQGIKQHVATEPEARLMRMGDQGFEVAYNAQVAVDARHKLIVAFDLTNEGNDSRQLHPMATQGKDELQVKGVTVVADSGYSNGEQGSQCEQSGITAIVPRPRTVNKRGKGHFSRDEFAYDSKTDSWRCPAGSILTRSSISVAGQKNDYTTKACGDCALKAQCTKSRRRVVRSFYEDTLEAMHQRAMSDPIWMKQRRSIVEHPFGTIKWMMGDPRFLLRGLKKAKAELALSVLSYNLKRVINIQGVQMLLNTLRPSLG